MSLTSACCIEPSETLHYRVHAAQDSLRENQQDKQGEDAKGQYARTFEEVKPEGDEYHDEGPEYGTPRREHAPEDRHEQHQEYDLDAERFRQDELVHERQEHAGDRGDACSQSQ